MMQVMKRVVVVFAFFGLVFSAGCGAKEANRQAIWIDVPVSGISVPPGTVNIEGHAAGDGIEQVEIWVNDAMIGSTDLQAGEGDLTYFSYLWQSVPEGEYTISVIPIGAGGASGAPDTAFIKVVTTPAPLPDITVSDTPTFTPTFTVTPEISLTPTLTPTSTVTLTPAALVQFWAEPETLEAGACTTIRWHAENVDSVIFGGIDQPMDGSYDDCLCSSQNFTLTVRYLNGTEEKIKLNIPVEGDCITPTPEEDGPPSAPDLQVPDNGAVLSCRGNQSLVWLPVNDMSGIASYQVEAQKRGEGGSWAAAPGSPITVADKTTSIPVECGFYYRWRVRATDGVGNTGDYSSWSEFSVPLE